VLKVSEPIESDVLESWTDLVKEARVSGGGSVTAKALNTALTAAGQSTTTYTNKSDKITQLLCHFKSEED
jgi:hypothetical protein